MGNLATLDFVAIVIFLGFMALYAFVDFRASRDRHGDDPLDRRLRGPPKRPDQ
jgi:hypothetical protein